MIATNACLVGSYCHDCYAVGAMDEGGNIWRCRDIKEGLSVVVVVVVVGDVRTLAGSDRGGKNLAGRE